MPREHAILEAQRRLRQAPRPDRTVAALPLPPLRVVDVALLPFDGEGAVRAYLDAKAAWARASGLIEHHAIVSRDGRARLPIGLRAVRATLRDLRPDVVLLHEPLRRAQQVAWIVHELDARVVAVQRGPAALVAASHGEREATLPLRLGVDPAFVPDPDLRRQDHVLYAGPLGRQSGVLELVHAAARSTQPWTLKLVGRGPIEARLRALARRLGLGERVRFYPHIDEPVRLARWFASARAVVMPGAHESFGHVGLQAAASGACVVTCSTAPSAALMRGIARTYEPGDIDGLLAAIEVARAAEPDRAVAAALGRRWAWSAVFATETMRLERLAGRRSGCGRVGRA